MRQDRQSGAEEFDLRGGPKRLESEHDFRREQELCFGDIDFDIYEQEDNLPPAEPHGPYGLNQSRLLTPDGEVLLFRRLSFLKVRIQALRSTLPTGRANAKKLREIEQNELQANATRNEIAQANLRLVASVARRLSSTRDDFEEMFAEGNTILLYAIDKFDYTRGYRFSTYLTHAVQRHLFRYIKRRAVRQAKVKMTGSEHLAEVPGHHEDHDQLSPEETLSIAQRIIDSIDDTLDQREQFIVRGRLGLDKNRTGQTFQSLGEQLGLSKERTRQLFQRAIVKLEQVAEPFANQFG